MSDLRFNSIAGAAIAAVLGVMGVGVLADAVVRSHYPEKAGFLPDVQLEAGGAGPAEPSGPPDFGRLFADPAQLQELVARGERVSSQCASCHTFDDGGPNRVGPNLHDVFGRPAASHAGFEYSEAMQAHDVTWDYLTLNDFLHAPSTAVRGTKMAFAGLRGDQDRVAMIAYLRSISPHDVALPAPLPEAAAPEAGAEGAEGAQTPPAPAQAENPAPTP